MDERMVERGVAAENQQMYWRATITANEKDNLACRRYGADG